MIVGSGCDGMVGAGMVGVGATSGALSRPTSLRSHCQRFLLRVVSLAASMMSALCGWLR